MPVYRYFFEGELRENSPVTLEGQEFHHLAHVTRMQEGGHVELVDGKGVLATARIEKCEKRKASLRLEKTSYEPPPIEMILAQAIPRPNRLDVILEKGTELGMSQLWLFPATASEKKSFNESQLQRMRAITIAAMKQCGRLYLPEIVLKPALKQLKSFPHPAFFGDMAPSASLFEEVWKQTEISNGVIFFIGPESGFTDEEITQLKKLKAQGVKLHANILRTDTAPLVALSLMQHWLLNNNS